MRVARGMARKTKSDAETRRRGDAAIRAGGLCGFVRDWAAAGIIRKSYEQSRFLVSILE
jgi:hypothetical protein